MSVVSKDDIKRGLRELGLGQGDIVVVHSALSAFGKVEGGAKTVVDALLETIGEEGTLLAPTQGRGRPFDARKSPSTLGAISEEIRLRPGAERSLSPFMPAAAVGARAKELVENHHLCEAPCIGSPYHLAAEAGGYVLLLGVDQDRNTTLHVAEALFGAPYLSDVEGQYVDRDGKVRVHRGILYPGPHRDFIGIEPGLREAGNLRQTVIGTCVARIMKGKDLIEHCLEGLCKDPAFFLTANDGYEDGIAQRGKIRAARVANEEAFALIARTGSAGRNMEEVLWQARRAGVSAVEADILDGRDVSQLGEEGLRYAKGRLDSKGLGVKTVRPGVFTEAAFRASMNAAAVLGAEAVVWPMTGTAESLRAKAVEARKAGVSLLLENVAISSADAGEVMRSVGAGAALAFNPAHFAAAGELAFLKSFRAIKRHVRYVALTDASPRGVPCYVGSGNGEVKEIVSILRCSSWDGTLCLGDAPRAMEGLDFDRMTDAFYQALDRF